MIGFIQFILMALGAVFFMASGASFQDGKDRRGRTGFVLGSAMLLCAWLLT